jgi:predicted porin
LSGGYGAALQSYDIAAVKQKGIATTDAFVKFTASEDLGGGLKATVNMQFAMGDERTTTMAKEDSSIALSGGFGTLTLSNTRTSDTAISANVFSAWMPVTSFYATVSSRVAADVVTYTLPAIVPGLTLSVSSVELNTSDAVVGAAGDGKDTSTNRANVGSASYVQGPLAVMAAVKNTNLSAAQVALGAKKSNTEMAVTYDFGVAKVGFGIDSKTSTTGEAMQAYGVSVPVGAFTFGVNGAKRGDEKFYDAGVNYDLSKRTSIRVMVGDLTGTSTKVATTGLRDTAKTNDGKQYRVGIYHAF